MLALGKDLCTDLRCRNGHLIMRCRGVAQLVARLLWEQEISQVRVLLLRFILCDRMPKSPVADVEKATVVYSKLCGQRVVPSHSCGKGGWQL